MLAKKTCSVPVAILWVSIIFCQLELTRHLDAVSVCMPWIGGSGLILIHGHQRSSFILSNPSPVLSTVLHASGPAQATLQACVQSLHGAVHGDLFIQRATEEVDG
eukprot:scaffold17366_cov17-Tisochrysis_lutea.AAC.1